MIFSAEPALIIIQKEKAPSTSFCVVDVLSMNAVLSKTWIAKPDDCEKSNLIKVFFNKANEGVYLPKEHLSFISQRNPSSIKKKSSK
jgi:hypothetical protein